MFNQLSNQIVRNNPKTILIGGTENVTDTNVIKKSVCQEAHYSVEKFDSLWLDYGYESEEDFCKPLYLYGKETDPVEFDEMELLDDIGIEFEDYGQFLGYKWTITNQKED